MKKVLFLYMALLTTALMAQTIPQGINYQAIALDDTGNPVPGVDIAGRPIDNSEIQVRFTFIEDNISGPEVYSETHTTNTDVYGMFNLVIGNGAVDLGSFNAIDWGNILFLKVDLLLPNASNFKTVATQELFSVPYSFLAQNVLNNDDEDADTLNEIQTLTLHDDTLQLSKAGYVVLPPDSDGNPMNEIQQLSISNDTIYLSDGGYIPLPFDPDQDSSNELQQIGLTNDSLYITNGGFVLLPMEVDGDSTNELQTLSLVGDTLYLSKGGSVALAQNLDNSISNELQSLVYMNDTLSLSNDSSHLKLFIPISDFATKLDELDDVNYTVLGSIGLGDASLAKDSLGENNTALGHFSLANNITGSRNSALGAFSLGENVNGDGNTSIGYSALSNLSTGNSNTALGEFSMAGLNGSMDGEENVAVGSYSLAFIDSGSNNVGLGASALNQVISGNFNTAIGSSAGSALVSGEQNVLIGSNSNTSTGLISNSIAIGYGSVVTENNMTKIGNSNTQKTILHGRLYSEGAQLSDSSSSTPILSLSSNTSGFLPPRLTSVERDSIGSPDMGLMLYCTDCIPGGELQVFNGTTWQSSLFTSTNEPPALSLNTPGSITETSADLGAVILHSGGLPILTSGIELSNSTDFTTKSSLNTSNPSTGTFELSFGNLSPNTTYYYRAYAQNALGQSQTPIASFSTNNGVNIIAPVLTFKANSTVITPISMAVYADFITTGSQPILGKGFLYGTNSALNFSGNYSQEGPGSNGFSSILTNLISDTAYFVQAYAYTNTDTLTSTVNQITTPASTSYFVGQLHGGGIIFYVDSTGQHGLIASLEDLGLFPWGCSGLLVDSTSTNLGTGLQNSNRIALTCFSVDSIAAVQCLNAVINGYGDWYLPSLDEMQLVKDNLYDKFYTQYFGTTEGSYWTSSENSATEAIPFQLFTGGQFGSSTPNKTQARAVHPVRSF